MWIANRGSGEWETERWRDGEMERRRDGETERWRDGEMERRRDGGTERQRDGAPLYLSASLSLCPSVSLSLRLSVAHSPLPAHNHVDRRRETRDRRGTPSIRAETRRLY